MRQLMPFVYSLASANLLATPGSNVVVSENGHEPFVFKIRMYLGGNPRLPLHAFVGSKSSASLVPGFSKGE